MSKKRKKEKNKKKFKNFDKISFEKREKIRAKLKKERVYTKAFITSQSFGAASKVSQIPIEEFLKTREEING